MILPSDLERNLAIFARAIRDIAGGQTRAMGSDVALSEGTETAVTMALCAPGSQVVLTPLDAGAAAAGLFLKDTARGSFTLGHAAGPGGRMVRFEVRRPS
ncbi:hypothetical protein [Methylobacterium organophilum]|uniref:Uncharacterized protein n=1 Tax=Methylobacterium organophilum TaxID=410 RepID=A0ABQ4TDY9_METOR|nr:hypothetical protein [Methylobacterium organophilum]GJE29808.1 hypothetical protein LKMONMHP_4694 [Methylobacterium organophilum]